MSRGDRTLLSLAHSSAVNKKNISLTFFPISSLSANLSFSSSSLCLHISLFSPNHCPSISLSLPLSVTSSQVRKGSTGGPVSYGSQHLSGSTEMGRYMVSVQFGIHLHDPALSPFRKIIGLNSFVSCKYLQY